MFLAAIQINPEARHVDGERSGVGVKSRMPPRNFATGHHGPFPAQAANEPDRPYSDLYM